ncbi:MAG: ATP-grasp domain-containing protein [Ruminococcaceae bacterium]|nr:ATP-grasp domain-containing protein [Oscillospiraceae bacterium]
MSNNTFFPIVLGSDENAYGTARLFNEAYKIKPLLCCTRQLTPTSNSCLFSIKQIPDFDKDEVFPKALLEVLKEYKKSYDKLIVIPCSDYYSALVSKHYDKFEGLISNKFISYDLLNTLDTKDKFYALCEKHGMDYPSTYIALPDDRIDAINKLPFHFPIVVKPENSNAYEYLHCEFEGKKKVFFFYDKQSYLKVMESMNKSGYKGKLIIQEYIVGDDSSMRVMNSYSDADGKVRLMCLGQPVLEEYHPKTLGNYAAIVSRSDTELYSKIKKFLEDIGYVGFSNIDIKYDRNRKKYYMMEINPRPGRSSFFVRCAGHNMMQTLVDDAVFEKNYSCTLNENISLWANVPKSVIFNYIDDEALRNEVKSLIKQKKYMRTLDCKEDFNIKRWLKIKRYYFSQYKNFKNYYFKKK